MEWRPKCKTQSYKILEENIVINICDLLSGNGSLDKITKSTCKKRKIGKLDSNKTKTLLFQSIIKKWKCNPQNGKKIFSNHISDRWLLSRIYKELLQINKTTQF